jgi:hypothetical protein
VKPVGADTGERSGGKTLMASERPTATPERALEGNGITKGCRVSLSEFHPAGGGDA